MNMFFDGQEAFEASLKKAGLAFILVGFTHVVWKQGLTTAWIVRAGESWPYGCYCSDCFCLYTNEYDELIVSQLRNIGLLTVAVGRSRGESLRHDEKSVESDFKDHGFGVIPPESSDVYQAYMGSRIDDSPCT